MKKRYFLSLIILLVIGFFILQSRKQPEATTPLSYAGSNKAELLKARKYFEQLGDSLKLQACNFLLEHMHLHAASRYTLTNAQGDALSYKPLEYPSYSTAKQAQDSLIENFNLQKTVENDIRILDSAYLVQNINLAFEAWEKNKVYSTQNFKQFLQYILPYRQLNENLSNWRPVLATSYSSLLDSLLQFNSPMQALLQVAQQAEQACRYSRKSGLRLGFGSVLDLKQEARGTCERTAVYVSSAMRALGIPVTIDKTTWAHRNSSHFWTVLLTQEPSVQLINSWMNQHTKVAKVWRYQYGDAQSELFQLKDYFNIPPSLRARNVTDATAVYVPTNTVELDLGHAYNGEVVYLTYFNSGAWVAGDWAQVKAGKAVFKNMGINKIVYLPCLFDGKEFESIGKPFIAQPDSSFVPITLNRDQTQNFRLHHTNGYLAHDFVDYYVEKGRKLELLYWDDQWVSMGVHTADTNYIDYEDLPTEGLYLVNYHDVPDNVTMRIFTLTAEQKPSFY